VTGVPVRSLARYFEYWLLRLEGVYPAVARCAGCGGSLNGGAALAGQDDALICLACTPATESDVSEGALDFLRASSTTAPEALRDVPLASGAAGELERLHRRLLTRHLDREPRSLRVLREMDATSPTFR
jgi:recombinational DNA repair protein (RecF pathway)